MLQKNEKFGSYLLLEKIASGGMAEIYLARSIVANGLNKFVAVKRILPHLTNDHEFIAMFKHEAKIAINLNHNNLASIFYFGCENNQYYLVMDYIEGKTLYQISSELKNYNERFSIEQALYLIKEAATGLDYAHRCVDPSNNQPLGVIHRDISPQNIMMSFDGAVKVIDFGIAKTANRNTTEVGTFKGKFNYMSPEQGEGIPLDHRSDVFSLGVILWEFLANQKLFAGNTNLEILRSVKRCDFKPLRTVNPSIPVELETIVNRALAKDRNERYQTAADFSRDLNRFLNLHYPNFSPTEFSKQIRHLFNSEYQKRRESLIEYSNLNVDEISKAQPTEKAAAKKSAKDYFAPVDVYEPAPPEDYQDPVLSVVTNIGDMPDGLDEPAAKNAEPPAPTDHDFAFLVNNTPAQPHEDINDHSDYVAPISVLIKNNQPETVKTITHVVKETQGDRFVKYAIMLCLLVLGYFGFNRFGVPLLKKSIEVRDLASVEGAQTKKIVTAPVPASENNIKAVPEKTTYQKAAETKIGFVNISLVEENPDVRISINDIQIIDKLPLLMYPIAAEREITISALNTKTKKMVHKKFQVGSGESKDLQFDMNAAAEQTK